MKKKKSGGVLRLDKTQNGSVEAAQKPVAWSKAYAADRVVLKDAIPLDLPLCISIEPTNLCNFRCQMCWQSTKRFREEGGPFQNMPSEVFDKALADIQSFSAHVGHPVKLIKLYFMGEPLLHPGIGDMVRRVKEAGVCRQMEITSNASLLTPELAKDFVDAGLDYFRVSVYAVRPERHRYVTQTKVAPEAIQQNVAKLYRYREAQGKTKPFICAKIMDTHDEEVNEFKAAYQAISDEQIVDIPWDLPGTGEGSLAKLYHGEAEGKKAMQEYLDAAHFKQRKACRYPFTHMMIRSNGDVTICCIDGTSMTKVGSILEQSLEEIWNGKALYDFRVMMLRDKGVHHPLCATCPVPLKDCPEDDIDDVPVERLSAIQRSK